MKIYQSIQENLFISKNGEIFYKDNNDEIKLFKRFYENKKGYYIFYNNSKIFVIDLMMDTFIGKSILKKKYKNDISSDCSISNMTYTYNSLVYSDNSILLDNEEFKRISLKTRNLYINNHGVIYDLDRRKFILPFIDDSYKYTYLEEKQRSSIHRLLYKTYHPEVNMDDYQVHHKNHNKLDNFIDNLDHMTINEHTFLTRIENSESTYAIRWSEDTIHKICNNLQNNINCIELCKELGLYDNRQSRKDFQDLVSDILKGQIWKGISSQYDFSKYDSVYHSSRAKANYSDEQIHEACRLIKEGYGRKVSGMSGVDPGTLYNIKNGISWKHISSKYQLS